MTKRPLTRDVNQPLLGAIPASYFCSKQGQDALFFFFFFVKTYKKPPAKPAALHPPPGGGKAARRGLSGCQGRFTAHPPQSSRRYFCSPKPRGASARGGQSAGAHGTGSFSQSRPGARKSPSPLCPSPPADWCSPWVTSEDVSDGPRPAVTRGVGERSRRSGRPGLRHRRLVPPGRVGSEPSRPNAPRLVCATSEWPPIVFTPASFSRCRSHAWRCPSQRSSLRWRAVRQPPQLEFVLRGEAGARRGISPAPDSHPMQRRGVTCSASCGDGGPGLCLFLLLDEPGTRH